MQVTYELYSSLHLDQLVPMWRSSFEQAVGIIDPNPIEEQRQYFLDHILPNNDVLVAMVGKTVVGFIAASSDSVEQLYVHTTYQRCGIGTTLLRWAMENSDGRLELYTFERNKRAQKFYEQKGFTIVARGFEEQWQLADIKYEWVAPEGFRQTQA